MDVILNKADSIERCIKRIHEEYDEKPENLRNFTRQDSIVLNLQRACELAIDMANYVNSRYRFSIPKSSRDSFKVLQEKRVISEEISGRLQKMVGFRNLAIHDYRKLDLSILQSIVETNLQDFTVYSEMIVTFVKENPVLL
ncbi:MAG: hypothetical protein CVV44_21325 [Spirochaetae bacterium HGW-Spirochaetae-1]|jgi:uncharacterized protein YutE (UPF0331/DUF86 family)|nr:MAG: hypothetical protein CVV44_21325 [Spirochaetae bacterium HGW-Spirochaetae-1]